MSYAPSKLYCDSFYPNTETSLTMGNGHTQFAGLSDMTYSWVVDTSNNLVLNGQSSGPAPAIQPIIISSNGEVNIPSLDISGSGVLAVSSSVGSGITCTGTTNVSVSSNFLAGTGIVLTPDISGTAITIACDISGGGSGIQTITSANGSGINVSGTTNTVLQANIIAGTNITLTPNTGDTGIVISASGASGGPTVDAVPAGTKTITMPSGNSIFNYTMSAGGGGGGGSGYSSSLNAGGGGGGGSGQTITGSMYCISGTTTITYSLGSAGLGGSGGNPTGDDGADGSASTLTINNIPIVAKPGLGGKGANQVGLGIAGDGGAGYCGGGGAQGGVNGAGGNGSLVSGTGATNTQNGQGGNNPFPVILSDSTTSNNLIGGNGGGSGGASASYSSLQAPTPASLGGGGGGACVNTGTIGIGNGGNGGDGYISYYFTQL